MSKFPVTRATGMEPGPIPHVTKNAEGKKSYDNAMNKPNDPQKRYRPGAEAVNVTDAYCDGDDSED